jgi:hypothetical protein
MTNFINNAFELLEGQRRDKAIALHVRINYVGI